jgi:hypothetical protein
MFNPKKHTIIVTKDIQSAIKKITTEATHYMVSGVERDVTFFKPNWVDTPIGTWAYESLDSETKKHVKSRGQWYLGLDNGSRMYPGRKDGIMSSHGSFFVVIGRYSADFLNLLMGFLYGSCPPNFIFLWQGEEENEYVFKKDQREELIHEYCKVAKRVVRPAE